MAALGLIGGTISLGLATSVCAQVTVTTTAKSTMAPIRTLGPGYVGLAFEKNKMANSTFDPVANANMVALLKLLSPHGVIKLGGTSGDTTSWRPNGHAEYPHVNGTPITQAIGDVLCLSHHIGLGAELQIQAV